MRRGLRSAAWRGLFKKKKSRFDPKINGFLHIPPRQPTLPPSNGPFTHTGLLVHVQATCVPRGDDVLQVFVPMRPANCVCIHQRQNDKPLTTSRNQPELTASKPPNGGNHRTRRIAGVFVVRLLVWGAWQVVPF